MAEIIEPLAGCRDPFSGTDDCCVAYNRHQISMRPGFHPQNAESVIGIVECHPLDQAS
jgi:hypothetical protein